MHPIRAGDHGLPGTSTLFQGASHFIVGVEVAAVSVREFAEVHSIRWLCQPPLGGTLVTGQKIHEAREIGTCPIHHAILYERREQLIRLAVFRSRSSCSWLSWMESGVSCVLSPSIGPSMHCHSSL